MNPFTYLAYDLLTGNLLGEIPLRGVTFGQQLNTAGSLESTLDLRDPRVALTEPLSSTVPNRTEIVVDYKESVQWAGIVLPRKWKAEASLQTTTGTLTVGCSETWAYFQGRVQATDYSSPPFSGITGASPMSLWTQTPWDASLIACQVISDAIGYTDSSLEPAGDILGGLAIKLNGATPSGASPASPASDYIAVNYPFTSMQTVDGIVTQLAQLGLGVGFDFGIDVAYTAGTGSAPIGTVNLSYPRRGRTVAENGLMVDVTTARGYEFPEDGTQTADQIYEPGGGGAIDVSANIVPIEDGYPLWERVISRASIQSQNIVALLAQMGLSDLAIYSYAPVTPTITLGIEDPNLPLGSFIVGDDITVYIPERSPDGREVYDPRFPAGMTREWRIIAWACTVADEGDATVKLTLARPPLTQALTPAV